MLELEELDISENKISSISILEDKKRLVSLVLHQVGMTDITAVNGLTALTELF